MFVGARSFFQDPFGFHFSLGKQFAQLNEAVWCAAQHIGHHRLADFHHVTIAVGAHSCATGLAGEQRHFAKAIARTQSRHLNRRSIF
jgi:hypothetical protein